MGKTTTKSRSKTDPKKTMFFFVDGQTFLSSITPIRVKQISSEDIKQATWSVSVVVNTLPPVQKNKSYRVEDILRIGKEAFFKSISPKSPMPMPELNFTEDENKKMDELMFNK